MAPRVRQVMKQTRARVFGGDTHVVGKLLSLFEPSTEIIRKGKAAKPNEFGKMVKLQEAENQIVIAAKRGARVADVGIGARRLLRDRCADPVCQLEVVTSIAR
jgi:hypothetical protein